MNDKLLHSEYNIQIQLGIPLIRLNCQKFEIFEKFKRKWKKGGKGEKRKVNKNNK